LLLLYWTNLRYTTGFASLSQQCQGVCKDSFFVFPFGFFVMHTSQWWTEFNDLYTSTS